MTLSEIKTAVCQSFEIEESDFESLAEVFHTAMQGMLTLFCAENTRWRR